MIKPIKKLKIFGSKTILAVLGIAIGVMSVIIVGFTGLCGIKAVNAEMDSIGLKGVAICPEIGEGNFSADEIVAIRSVPGVKDVSPVFAVVCSAMDKSGCMLPVVAFGCENTQSTIFSVNKKSGDDINEKDVENLSAVCVVSDKLSGFLNLNNTIRLSVEGKSAEFLIKGIVSTDSELLNGSVGDCIPSFIYVPYTSLQVLTGDRGYSQVIIMPQNAADSNDVSLQVMNSLADTRSSRSVKMIDLDTQRNEFSALLSSAVGILKGIAGVSLAVASLLTTTVMTVTVAEKRRETAIKGLIGATRLQIVGEFMLMSLKLCTIGVIIGTVLGILSTYLVSYLLDIEFFIDVDSVLMSDLSAVVSGLSLSFFPVIRSIFSFRLNDLKKI